MVHYAEELSPLVAQEDPPAPPEEVLARSGSEAEDTSAGAAQQATIENQVHWGEVIMRGTVFYAAYAVFTRSNIISFSVFAASKPAATSFFLVVVYRFNVSVPYLFTHTYIFMYMSDLS